jgi:GTP-binding protein EngB required for normal cell division
MNKQLLIEEMKRAIEIMESKEELTRVVTVDDGRHPWQQTDRDITELFMLFKLIRKHTSTIEKGAKNDGIES